MTATRFLNPVFETVINKAVFINQDIIVYPENVPFPDNIPEVIKFLFGKGACIEQAVDNQSACLRIKGASYVLSGVRTLNSRADLIIREVKEIIND